MFHTLANSIAALEGYFSLEIGNNNYIPPNCTIIRLKDASKLSFLCNFLKNNNNAVKKVIILGSDWFAAPLGNEIGEEGAKEIAEVLKVNQTITRLDMSSNKIRDEGAKAIAKALKVNCSITHLELSCNAIGEKGAKAIAAALKVNRTITTLWLQLNQIGDEGTKAIAEALKVNCTVKELFLSMNDIDDEGGKAISEALKVNCTITELYLSALKEDEIRIEDKKTIENAVQVNCIIEAELEKNIVADEQCKTIALGLFSKVPIYLLLDIQECITILNLEEKTDSCKFYNNTLFLKFLERKVSKKRPLSLIDKVNRQIKSI